MGQGAKYAVDTMETMDGFSHQHKKKAAFKPPFRK
jgi:hypothetical protein